MPQLGYLRKLNQETRDRYRSASAYCLLSTVNLVHLLVTLFRQAVWVSYEADDSEHYAGTDACWTL